MVTKYQHRTQRDKLTSPSPPPRFREKVKGMLEWWWANWWLSFTAAAVLAGGFGLISAWWTPRSPVTTSQALVSLTIALVVGIGAGLVTGSRWSLLATPAVFAVVFEVARMGTVGPTVDAIDLSGFFGVVAFVLGRVFHGILVLVPMVLGAALGLWLAARLGHPTARMMGGLGWTITVLGLLGLILLAALILRPAATAPILDSEGEPVAGSVAELVSVPVGGHDQVLMIRGRSIDNPVLLYLTGGPGGTDIGAIRRDVTLEQDFTVVVWEQRGAGKSYAALDPTETFTLDQFVSDTIEVTDYLRGRFDQDRIYIVGQSWGSTLGILAVREAPELYHAFVGVGQMVSQTATDILFWEDTLAWAEATGNTGLAATLIEKGPPPYEQLMGYDPVVSHEHDWNRYPEMDLSNEMPDILFVPEYTLMDRINAFRGFLDTNATLYPQLRDLDFRHDVPRLEVPYYMVLGEHEARGRAVLAEEWFAMMSAPIKERIIVEGGGHRAHFDQPVEFAQIMQGVFEKTDNIALERGES